MYIALARFDAQLNGEFTLCHWVLTNEMAGFNVTPNKILFGSAKVPNSITFAFAPYLN